MQKAIVIVPKANLYNIDHSHNCCNSEQEVSDELLSGWTVTLSERRGTWGKVTTHYGYCGWLKLSDIKILNQQDCKLWEDSTSGFLLVQRLTDVLAAPKVQASLLTTLFMGSHVLPCCPPENGWQKIKLANTISGYLPSIAVGSPQQNMPLPREEYLQAELRSAILAYAYSYLGTQYRWGGKTHEGIDCSGLTFMSYYMCGVTIYRDAVIQSGFPVREIPFSNIKPADLLYFPGHIALYIGNGQYIHSTGNSKSFGCVINSLNPDSTDYRKDLAESLYAVGSVFP